MGKSIKEALQEAASYLKGRHIDGAREEAELLLAFLLQVERPFLYAHGAEELTPAAQQDFAALCHRRGTFEPLAYIRGEKEFMWLNFYVKRGVFIPRPETEHLVEGVLDWVRANKPAAAPLEILDLGTGSGCIAVCLALQLPLARLTAVDVEPKALAVARRNSFRHGVHERITFLQGDFSQALAPEAEGVRPFDVIVSNPPYIEESYLPGLQREVRQEPRRALSGGADGLEAYREITGKAAGHLRKPGLLALELGKGQEAAVGELACRAGFTQQQLIKDYAGIDRVLLCDTGM